MVWLLVFPDLAHRQATQAMALEQHHGAPPASRVVARGLRVGVKPRGSQRGSQSRTQRAAIRIYEGPLDGRHENSRSAFEDEVCHQDTATARSVDWEPK